jgi:hypothetical protein
LKSFVLPIFLWEGCTLQGTQTEAFQAFRTRVLVGAVVVPAGLYFVAMVIAGELPIQAAVFGAFLTLVIGLAVIIPLIKRRRRRIRKYRFPPSKP